MAVLPWILVVDDDADVRIGVSTRLRIAGYQTLLACDGEDAVQMAAKLIPDVVLMDVRMPRKDGLTALAELRGRPHTNHIPVVMMSASLHDEKSALSAGADFFLRKPYSGHVLLWALNTALASAPARAMVIGEINERHNR